MKASPLPLRGFRRGLLPWLLFSLAVLVGCWPGAAPCARAQSGSLDLSFDAGLGPDAQVDNLILQPDGKTLVQGVFSNIAGVHRPGLARVNADGSLDPTFDTGVGPDFFISTATLLPNGQVFVGGDFSLFNNVPRLSFALLNPDGNLDPNFGGQRKQGTNGRVLTSILQPDGKIIIGGDFASVDEETFANVARLKPDASIDGQFKRKPGRFGFFVDPPRAVAIQPDGKVLFAGFFGTTEPYANGGFQLVRVDDRNRVDTSFNPGNGINGINGNVRAVVLQPDGKILAGGTFVEVNRQPSGGIVRLNPDGSVDPTFTVGVGFDQAVNALLLQPDGRIVVGGFFGNYNGVTRGGTARLNADGSLDASFVPAGANGEVNALALQPDGRLLIGGDFTRVGNVRRVRVARLNPDGTPDQGNLGPAVTITALRKDITQTGGQSGILALTRTGDVSQPLTVTYTVTGTAFVNVNFEPLPGTATFAAGADTFLLQVVPINAPIPVPQPVKVKVALNPGDGYVVGNPGRAKVRISQ